MSESWADANRRRSCLMCGASGALLLRTKSGINIRACVECLRGSNLDEEWRSASSREAMYEEVEFNPFHAAMKEKP